MTTPRNTSIDDTNVEDWEGNTDCLHACKTCGQITQVHDKWNIDEKGAFLQDCDDEFREQCPCDVKVFNLCHGIVRAAFVSNQFSGGTRDESTRDH